MRILTAILGVILAGVGIYNIVCVFLRIPSTKAAKLAQKYAIRASPAEELERAFVRPLVKLFADKLPMSEAKEEKRTRILARAGINYNAKEYLARLIVLGCYAALLAGFVALVSQGLIAILVLIIGILLIYRAYRRPDEVMAERRAKIEYELPRFIRTFIHGLKSNREILPLLERYAQSSEALGPELERLIADIKTSNYEEALVRFDLALDIPALSNFISALISQSRGEDQTATFNSIATNMSAMARENLRRELNKRPGKIKRATIPMVIMTFGIYLYVIIVNIMEAFSQITV